VEAVISEKLQNRLLVK